MRANKGEIKKRVTIAFDAEHKVLIQLGTSAGVLKTNQPMNSESYGKTDDRRAEGALGTVARDGPDAIYVNGHSRIRSRNRSLISNGIFRRLMSYFSQTKRSLHTVSLEL
jgi:hypothetical protein